MNEKEKSDFNVMNRELGEIKSDVKAIHDKMDDYNREHGRIHIENKEDIKNLVTTTNQVLIQATKTNGRVTSLEGTVEMLAKVSSQNSGLIAVVQKGLEDVKSWKRSVMAIVAFAILVAGGISTVIVFSSKLYFEQIAREEAKSQLDAFLQNYDKVIIDNN